RHRDSGTLDTGAYSITMTSMSAPKLLRAARRLLRWDDLELVGERLQKLGVRAWRGLAQSLLMLAGVLILISPKLPSETLVGAASLAGTLALVRALLARSAAVRAEQRIHTRATRDETHLAVASALLGLVFAGLIAWPPPLPMERQCLLAGIALIGTLASLRTLGASPLVFFAHATPLVVASMAAIAALPESIRSSALIVFALILLLLVDVAYSVLRAKSDAIAAKLRERGLLAQQWALFSTSQLAIALTRNRQIDKANNRFRQMFGEGSGEALLSDLAHTLGRSRGQLDRLIQRADARVRGHRSVSLNILREGPTPRYYSIQIRRFDPLHRSRGLLWSVSDQTSEWLRRQALERAASRDPLTGALNRRAFEQKLKRMLRRDLQRHPIAVLCLDLNGFRELNETHGHAFGDQVLCVVTKRMQHMLRSQDLIARLEGDSFVVVLEQIDRVEGASAVGDKLAQPIAGPVVRTSTSCSLGVSIGIALAPRDGRSAAALLANADTAMYAVKRALRRNRSRRTMRRSDTDADPRDSSA